MIDDMEKNIREVNRKYWTEMVDLAEKHDIHPSLLVRVTHANHENHGPLPGIYHIDVGFWLRSGYTVEFAIGVNNGKPIFESELNTVVLTSGDRNFLSQFLRGHLNKMTWDESSSALCIIDKIERKNETI